ncbi:MAG TPA: Calx-beta domain-containing protein [Pyrinomonadaceae bacterium]|nr:Calx-beta domain-containing protein [Pyrinomonadaceae bacterium]
MFKETTNRAPAVASRKTMFRLGRNLAALSSAACLAATLLWHAAGTRAEGPPRVTASHAAAAPAAPAAQLPRGKIAFVRGTHPHLKSDIYAVDADGTSAAVRLTNSDSLNVEPAWSPDNSKIAFASARDGNLEIYVMNADGSGQTNLTRSAATETSPAWSPDGARIAFVAFVEGRGYQIHVMDADGGNRRNLSGDRGGEREPAWSPDGTRIAFSRDSGIHIMNADGSGLRRLTDGFAPAWSPDGTRIAFVSRGWPSTGGQTIRVVNPDGTGERVVAVPPNQTTGPTWSPDGSEVAYDAADYAFFRIEVDGCREVRQIAGTTKFDRQPAWQWPPALPAPAPAPTPCPASSPTPTPPPRATDRVLFTSLRDGNHEIYVMNGDGTGQTNLTNNPAQDATPVWSPDGTRIAFASNRTTPSNPHGASNIFVMNADGSGVRQVTDNGRVGFIPSIVYDPAWSPDGTKLVFVSSFMGEMSHLAVINVDDGVGTGVFISTTQAADPAWSPDGTRIAFVGAGGVSNPEDLVIGARHLFVVNADGSGKTKVADMVSPFDSFGFPPPSSGPAWSPDGKRLAFVSNRDGNDEIYVVGASGGNLTRLTSHPAQDLMPAWLPDGSGIAFTSYRDAQQRDIYVMSADGGAPARLTTHPADDYDADWRGAQPVAPPAAESTIQPSQASFRIREAGPYGDTITITRLGDLSREATVEFTTLAREAEINFPAGQASERSDYVRAYGTLYFAPGEASQTINITVIDDALVEGDEFFLLALSNPTGAALGARAVSVVVITDNDSDPSAQNPIDTPHFMVRMHYLDFLGREPEPTGLQAWVDVLNRCPNPFNIAADNPSAACDRILVSSSFFRSPEFGSGGYFIYLLYRVGLGRSPTYAEFVRDLKALAAMPDNGIVPKKLSFAMGFAEREEFKELYRDRTTPEAFVDRLLQNSGLTLGGEVTRDSLVEDLRAGRKSRAQVLLVLVEHPETRAKEFNGAFVTMQYFGYLKRDPEEAGYNAWLRYLNANPSDFRTMIHGFLNSVEYRSRFGRP